MSWDRLARLNPDSLRHWDCNDDLLDLRLPDIGTRVVLVVLMVLASHWHSCGDRQECAGHGENAVGKHVDCSDRPVEVVNVVGSACDSWISGSGR